MRVVESTRTRRLVGRLERGAELVAAVGDLCRQHGVRAGEVRAFGTLVDAELGAFDPHAPRPARRFSSPFTIAHCAGTVTESDGKLRVELGCALSRDRDGSNELLGGRLLRAEVYSVELVIEAFDDVMLQRSTTGAAAGTHGTNAAPQPAPQPEKTDEKAGQKDRVAPAGGLAALQQQAVAAMQHAEATPAPKPAIPFEAPARGRIAGSPEPDRSPRGGPVAGGPPADPSWEEVARASARRDGAPGAAEPIIVDDEPPPDPPLREGDVIDHPRFGRCEVVRVEGDAEYAQVQLRNRRLVRLSLDVLQIVRDGHDETGQRRWRVVLP